MAVRSPLSLRLRVLAAIALVVVLGAASGTVFAGWLARQTLRDELRAAMTGGAQTVARALDALPRSDDPQRDLRRLIATFDGNRHVLASLTDAHGAPLAASHPPASLHAAPPWFLALLDPRLETQRIAAPGGDAVVLTPAPGNDVGDAWLQFGYAMMVLGLVGLAGAVLVYITIGRALRPLRELSAAFGRVGLGDYGARVDADGPAEVARLAASFNAMAGDLEAMRRRTRVLEEQVLKLQDEERAELARDLHDEIGPHLFAVNIDAAMLGQALAAGRQDEAARQVGAIQAAVGHMQRRVRDILTRLRPAQLVELGLGAAIGELVEFWRSRRPDIDFAVDLAADEALLPDAVQEAIYRIVQEGLSNAVRHGQPGRIEIAVTAGDGGEAVVRVVDDGLGRQGEVGAPGLGLVGMRERIEALGGSLEIRPGAAGGWAILARAPLAPDRAFGLGRAAQ
jgi:two-component system, NarL family, sensor histidine kinase UhpB